MVNCGTFDAASHNQWKWHTYPKGFAMRRLDANDVAWWSDAGALLGIELPNLSAGSVGHQGVTLGTPVIVEADAVGERWAVALDGTNDSISIGAASYQEGYFNFRAAETHLIEVAGASSLDVTGDLTLIVKVAMNTWTPGSIQTFFSRWAPPSNRVVLLRINGAGRILYNWSSDGANQFQVQSSESFVAGTNEDRWVAITHDVNNGSGGNTVRFYHSSSPSMPSLMTALGVPITDPSAITSIFQSSSAPIRLGSRDGNQERLYGRVKTAILRSSIGAAGVIGTTNEVFRIDADAIVGLADTTVALHTPTAGTATVTGDILVPPVGAGAALGPGESGTIVLTGVIEATQVAQARIFDSRPVGSVGGVAIYATGAGGTGYTAAANRAGTAIATTVAETVSNAAVETVVLRIDRLAALLKLWTFSGGETTTALSAIQASVTRFGDNRIGASPQETNFANFDFYSGAIFRSAISDADRDLISNCFRNATDTYQDGDFWTVTTPGIFEGIFFMPGDQVLATGTGNKDTVVWARIPVETIGPPLPGPVDRTTFGIVEMNGPPSTLEASFFDDPIIYPYRRLDILNQDGSLWRENAALISGSVNIEYGRDERRSGDCRIYLPDAQIGPDGLWYDKVLKFYRGITFSQYHRDPNYASATLVWQIGSFMVDRITESTESDNFNVTFRDLAKRMMLSKLTEAVTFPEDVDIAVVIRAVAANSGIEEMIVPTTGKPIGKDVTFEQSTSRWEIAKKISTDFGYELFFDHRGWMVMRPFTDPLTSPIYLSLVAKRAGLGSTGQRSNVGSFERATSDERIYNHIVVIGEGTDRTTVIRAEAENDVPTSPTAIRRIGRRTMTHTSSFITTQVQAQETANALLAINALEQFTISVGTIVYPWVEVGTTIRFEDDEENTFPDRFLLTTAGIPLGLEAMSLSGSRVTIVGSPVGVP